MYKFEKLKNYLDSINPYHLQNKDLNEQLNLLIELGYCGNSEPIKKAIINNCINNQEKLVINAINNLGLRYCVDSYYDELNITYKTLINNNLELSDLNNACKVIVLIMKESRGSMNPNSIMKILNNIIELEK